MNKLIGLGLGAALLANQTANNDNTKRQAAFNPDYKLVTVTAYFNNSTHYDQNVKSSNGFFYQKGEQTYLVSTAHSIIDNWQSVDFIEADKVKISIDLYDPKLEEEDFEIKDYHFSRYFDVLVAKVSNKFKQYAYNQISENPVKKVKVVYLDPLSNNQIEKEAEYVDQIAASMHLGAINHPLKQGSSGAPVVYNGDELVSMVTTTDQEYQNMTLCIPVQTIDSIIKHYGKNPKYLGFETNLINSGWLSSLPFTLKQNLLEKKSLGELVINSSIDQINPFDIITSVNGQAVGNGKDRSVNLALALSDSKDKVKIEGFKISESFRNKFCAYPREFFFTNKRFIEPFYRMTFFNREADTNIINVKSNIYKANIKSLVNQRVVVTDKKNSFNKFFIITKIENDKIFLDNNLNLPKSKSYLDSYVLKIFLDHSVYQTNLKNKLDLFPTTSLFKETNDLSNPDSYKLWIITALFKNWCFIVLNMCKSKDYGLQFKIVQKELKRWLKIINDNFTNVLNKDITTIYRYRLSTNLIKQFLDKSSEFLGPNTINLNKMVLYLLFKLSYENQFNLSEEEKSKEEEGIKKSIEDDYQKFVKENPELTGNISSFDTQIPKKLFDENSKLSDYDSIINGDSNFIQSGFQNEHYNFKNSLSDRSTFQADTDFRLSAKNLELVYQELELVLKKTDLGTDKLYYIKYYTNIKSYWDHANITVAQVLQSPLLKYEAIGNPNNSVETRDIEKFMDTFSYTNVLGLAQGKGSCWITTYLHQENLLTKQDLETFSNLTFYGLKNHPDFTQAYRSTFQPTMESFKQKASKDECLNLQSWSKQILEQINANQLEEAFQGFKNKVLQLTNQYNPDLQFDSIEALDSYFLAKH